MGLKQEDEDWACSDCTHCFNGYGNEGYQVEGQTGQTMCSLEVIVTKCKGTKVSECSGWTPLTDKDKGL